MLPHAHVIPGLTDRLLAKGVTIGARSDDDVPSLLSVAANWLPLLIFYRVFYVLFARPVLTLARQIEAYVRLTTDSRAGEPPAPT